MRQRFVIFSGIFLIMALSNAIVPILPGLGETSTHQGAIFSAYFLGALITVFPAGVFSDRIGRAPFIRAGLLLTCAGTALILISEIDAVVLAGRLAEGIGAGLFLPVALSWVNSQAMHEKMSGIFFASLNTGLVVGLVVSGFLAVRIHVLAGLFALMVLAIIVLLLSLLGRGDFEINRPKPRKLPNLLPVISNYRWPFIFCLVAIGATGAVTTLYPELSGEGPFLVSVEIGVMNISTAATVLLISRMRLEPIPVMQASGICMGTAVLISYMTPIGLAIMGVVAAAVMISLTTFLAGTGHPQGMMMGLFSLFSYAGMTLMPFITGIIADLAGFGVSFLILALICGVIILRVHTCRCMLPQN